MRTARQNHVEDIAFWKAKMKTSKGCAYADAKKHYDTLIKQLKIYDQLMKESKK